MPGGNGKMCCVFGCRSYQNKNLTTYDGRPLSWHAFPEEGKGKVRFVNKLGVEEWVDRRLAWLLSLKMEKKPTRSMKVCGLHFSKQNYILPDIPTKRPRLKTIAYPDQNLPAVPKRGPERSPKKRRFLDRIEHACCEEYPDDDHDLAKDPAITEDFVSQNQSSPINEEMVTCCAFGCSNNNKQKIDGLTFHVFPADPKQRKKWEHAIRRKNWTPNPRSSVCSVHFRDKWFDRSSPNVVRLREGAVPDIFPAIESILSRAIKRKADGNFIGDSPRSKNAVVSKVVGVKDSTAPGKRESDSVTVLQNSRLPDGSSCELVLTSETSPKTNQPRFSSNGRVNVKQKLPSSVRKTARKSTTVKTSQSKIYIADSDSGPTKTSERHYRVKTTVASTQTTVTLQEAFDELLRVQQEVLTLRQQLQLAREDNQRLQTRLNLLGPLTCPGDIVLPSKSRTVVKGNQQWQKTGGGAARKPSDPNDIWDSSEVQVVPTGDDVIKDPRHQPTVSVVYKQKVGAEDLFLQMGRKTPMTSSCESMIITLTMKGETMKDIDCNITEKFLDIRSPLYRYHMPFPNTVDPDTAEAEWNSPVSQLIITVNLVRELDAVNF